MKLSNLGQGDHGDKVRAMIKTRMLLDRYSTVAYEGVYCLAHWVWLGVYQLGRCASSGVSNDNFLTGPKAIAY
jgi:hypothetical protein